MPARPGHEARSQYISFAGVGSCWVFQVWIRVPGIVCGPKMVRHRFPDMMRPLTKCHSCMSFVVQDATSNGCPPPVPAGFMHRPSLLTMCPALSVVHRSDLAPVHPAVTTVSPSTAMHRPAYGARVARISRPAALAVGVDADGEDGGAEEGVRGAPVGMGASDPGGDVAGSAGRGLDEVPPGGEVRKVGLVVPGAGAGAALPLMPIAFSQLPRATYAAVPSAPRETTMAAMAASKACRLFSLLSHLLSWL